MESNKSGKFFVGSLAIVGVLVVVVYLILNNMLSLADNVLTTRIAVLSAPMATPARSGLVKNLSYKPLPTAMLKLSKPVRISAQANKSSLPFVQRVMSVAFYKRQD